MVEVTIYCNISWRAGWLFSGRYFLSPFFFWLFDPFLGNYFGQSFPFVMKRILDAPFQLLGVDLSVKNAAIGGCVFLFLQYSMCMEKMLDKAANMHSLYYCTCTDALVSLMDFVKRITGEKTVMLSLGISV